LNFSLSREKRGETMAKINLRAYIREIEEMVDSGRYAEAIAHCRYILDQYPKHVASYRLLGKALLESRRFGDAADIFQRVLSCIPDDFIAHLGLSIIREDEGNLDAAIWHMERSFEVQPSNAAVQAELRRLYGRRDGLVPPKVHLTRGALARMSAKSRLYSQAVTELRAALSEDPHRPDLQVLLASIYALSDQRVAAADTCSALLNKLPNCLEANRILADILPGTERAGEAQVYRQRLEALDPYAAHLSPLAPTLEQVADDAVTLERLQYDEIQAAGLPAQPAWAASLGVSIDEPVASEEPLPEWLSSIAEETPIERPALSQSPERSEEEVEVEREIPEAQPAELESTMEPSSSEPETPLGIIAQESGEPEAPAEEEMIPTWLTSLAPEAEAESSAPPPSEIPLPSPEETGLSDASQEGETVSAEEPELPELAQAMGETPVGEEPLPDWLSVTGGAVPEEQTSEVPEWLKDLESTVPQGTEPAEELPPSGAEEVFAEQEVDLAPAEIPDWLREIEISTPHEELTTTGEQPSVAPLDLEPEEIWVGGGEIPDWLATAMDAGEIEGALDTPALQPEAAPIEGDTQPVRVSGEPLTLQAEEALPEIEEISVEEPLIAEEIPSEPGALPAVLPEGAEEALPVSIEEEDAAIAWLEGLAARQGALEEEMLTRPEERLTGPPEWVQKVSETAEEVLPTSLEYEEEITEEPAVGELVEEGEGPAFELEEEQVTQEPAAVELVEEGEITKTQIPEFIAEAPVSEEFYPAEPTPAPESEEELPQWLREFAEEPTPAAVEEAPSWLPSAVPTGKIPEPSETERLDVNAASLAQLERIPGLGFILAQNIVSQREAAGPFTSLDGLAEVPGITPEAVAELKHWLTVEVVTEVARVPSPTVPAQLVEAWSSLTAGDLPAAVDQYSELIRTDQHLDLVIKDLQEALLLHPVDPTLYQALGDAYLRTDQLQEALDAYNRAEELLR
jgi:tetratricopeptide (TPR) repeat protein